VEQAAVRIVALELGLQGGVEAQRLGRGRKPRLNIVGRLGHAHGGHGLQIRHAILKLDVLLVLGDESLLLDIAVVVHGPDGRHTVLEAAHVVGWGGEWKGDDDVGSG
jgi:hypothetical protein